MIKRLIIYFLFLFNFAFSFAEEIKPLQSGKIQFDTFYTFDYGRINSGIYKNSSIKGTGNLFLPKNLGKTEKIPLILILHTSGGVKSNRENYYAKFLREQGYAAYVIDTYGSRKCNASGSGWKNCLSKILMLDFVTDAYMALNKLSTHPNIDPQKTILLGFSYGADAAMWSLDKELKDLFSPNQEPFKSVISVYGACNNILNINETIGSNFYYIVGSRDISYNKADCAKRYQELKNAGSTSKEYVIENAVHGFDADFQVLTIPNSEIPDFFSNCKFEYFKDGSVIEQTTKKKINLNPNDKLKDKFKAVKNYTFSEIKACYGNKSLVMGRQNFAIEETKKIFLEILKNEIN